VHWHVSPTLTTQHLLTVIAMANTMMSISAAAFLPEHDAKRRLLRRMSSTILNDTNGSGSKEAAAAAARTTPAALDQLSAESSQLKQGWSLVAALHCVLLPELIAGAREYKSPRIELLARRCVARYGRAGV
jgi:hypothetical protein